MRIEVDKLEKGDEAFAHRYEPEELVLDDQEVRLTEAPEVRGRAARRGPEVRLRGHITARAEVECDRCLGAVAVPIETDFDVTYIPAAQGLEPAAELQEEDLSRATFDGVSIDVDELVREQVLLALPARALCREECKGLCPVCGANKNGDDAACGCDTQEIDPRWAELKNLRL